MGRKYGDKTNGIRSQSVIFCLLAIVNLVFILAHKITVGNS